MNAVETFALFVVMIVVFWFFGLIGLAILGLIIILLSRESKKDDEIEGMVEIPISKRSKQQQKQLDKPCFPHGLVNCPFCYPNLEDSATEESTSGCAED
jgi:ABC-type multidrug transport system fused ATPase/permease subunit